MEDSIAASPATCSKMAKKLRKVYRRAIQQMRERRGQLIGGQREFVVISAIRERCVSCNSGIAVNGL